MSVAVIWRSISYVQDIIPRLTSMNDSPRTDAAKSWFDDEGTRYVHADFARQLETELAAATLNHIQDRDYLRSEIAERNDRIAALERKLAETCTRLFPIIQRDRRDRGTPHPMRIPWDIAELAYSKYAARYGTEQSLERLAQRGGFHAGEMDELLPDWIERCDRIAALEARLAERDKLIEDMRKCDFLVKDTVINALKADIARVEAERDAALADAERYRWLREHPETEDIYGRTGNELDAAIDAARAAQGEGEK